MTVGVEVQIRVRQNVIYKAQLIIYVKRSLDLRFNLNDFKKYNTIKNLAILTTPLTPGVNPDVNYEDITYIAACV